MRSNQSVNRSTIGWLLVVMQLVVFVVLLLMPWRHPTPLLLALGLVLMAAGAALGLWAGRILGRALTPTPVPIPEAGLRTSGAYAYVRHPIYSALLLATLGFLVAFGSPWSWAWGVVIVLFFWGKSRWEDSLLREQYDGEWEAWASTTGALIPRLRRGRR